MSYILGISNTSGELQKLCEGYNFRLLPWPQAGIYGNKATIAISEACAKVKELELIDCIICEYLSSSPILFHLRRNGYQKPIVLIPHYNPYPLRNLIHGILYAQCLGPADIVLAGSRSAAKRYRKLFDARVEPHPALGIDTHIFTKREKELSRKKLKLPGGKLLLYTGRLQLDKNVTALLLVYQSLKVLFNDLTLVLSITFSEDALMDFFIRKSERVIIIENSDSMTLSYLYSAADLFISCSTSYHETFGKSPLESIACGTPVVVPDWNGFQDYIDNRVGRRVACDILDTPLYDSISFAMINIPKFIEACFSLLNKPLSGSIKLDERLSSESAAKRFSTLLSKLTEYSKKTQDIDFGNKDIRIKNNFIKDVVGDLGVKSIDDLLELSMCTHSQLPILSKKVARELYNVLYLN